MVSAKESAAVLISRWISIVAILIGLGGLVGYAVVRRRALRRSQIRAG